MLERVIRTLKERCCTRHRFETLQHASHVLDGLRVYNHRQPRQALKMKTPAETFALAAEPEQILLDYYLFNARHFHIKKTAGNLKSPAEFPRQINSNPP